MKCDHVLRARVERRHLDKVNSLAQATGLTAGQVLRLLVERAEVQGAPVVRATLQASSQATQQPAVAVQP